MDGSLWSLQKKTVNPHLKGSFDGNATSCMTDCAALAGFSIADCCFGGIAASCGFGAGIVEKSINRNTTTKTRSIVRKSDLIWSLMAIVRFSLEISLHRRCSRNLLARRATEMPGSLYFQQSADLGYQVVCKQGLLCASFSHLEISIRSLCK